MDEHGKTYADVRAEGRRWADHAWVGLNHGTTLANVPSGQAIERLQRRAVSLARLHVAHAEPWQVVRYPRGGYQKFHDDGFHDPAHNTTRAVTVLVYLTDLSEGETGGQTNFPYARGSRAPYDPHACAVQGRSVVPRRGDAIMYYNVKPRAAGSAWRPGELALDEHARHAACPLTAGEKHIANVWMHSAPKRL